MSIRQNKKIIKILVVLSSVVSVVLISGCIKRSYANSSDIIKEGGFDIMREGKFHFGVGYTRKGTAKIFKKMGVKWAKVPLVYWGKIEPNPPRNGKHNYLWDKGSFNYDSLVREFTDNGFNLQLVLRTSSTWGTRYTDTKSDICGIPSSAPKPEYYDDYLLWVKEVIERYDCDGIKDMPGLSKPVLHYELNSEVMNSPCFKGTPEEYVEMLKDAYVAIKQANPRAQLILSGINFGDIFDDIPLNTITSKRIQEIRKKMPVELEFIEKTLSQTDSYDFVEFHYNRDYKGIFGTIDFIRRYSDKPIWAGDTTSAPWIKSMHSGEFNPYFSDPEIGNRMYNLIMQNNSEAVKWIRKKQSEYVVKKLVASIGAGLDGVIMETTIDWGKNSYNWAYQGLLDFAPRPAYYTYKQLIEKIGNYDSVERINLLGDVTETNGKGVWMYKFKTPGKDTFVLWYDDLINGCPICDKKEEVSAVVDLSKYLSTGNVKITYIIEKEGQTEPETEVVSTKAITVSESPIFVEETTEEPNSSLWQRNLRGGRETPGNCPEDCKKEFIRRIYSAPEFGFVADSAIKGNYAYLVGERGLAVLDIKNPHKPKLIKQILSDKVPLNDIFIDGNYAYVTAGLRRAYNGKLKIFNISNPAKIYELENDLVLPESPIGIVVEDGIAYIGDQASGLFLIDVKNPNNPTIISNFPIERIPDPVLDKLIQQAVKNPQLFIEKYGSRYGFSTLEDFIEKYGSRYGFSTFKDGLKWINHTWGTKAHVWWLDFRYPYVFLGCDAGGIYIVDVSNPSNPVKVGSFNKEKSPDGRYYWFNDVEVVGDYAFIALDYAGLLVLDVSDVRNPQEVAHVDPWPSSKWETSPGHMIQIEVKNNTAYLTAGKDGLYVYDISNPENPVLITKFPESAKSGKGCAWGLFVKDNLVTIGYWKDKTDYSIKGAFEIFEIERRRGNS